jgi:hypothetical protein
MPRGNGRGDLPAAVSCVFLKRFSQKNREMIFWRCSIILTIASNPHYAGKLVLVSRAALR